MIQASLLEQISIFWNILISNKAIWIILGSSVGLVLLLGIGSIFHNKKITKILYSIAYLGIFGTLIWFYHNEILELIDYLINNIFLFLFFPNLAVYTLVIVFVNVIIIKSTFSNSDSKLVKILNIMFFIVFNIIFYLIIDNVIKNSVNVYEQLSIYTNNNLLVLIELSMKLFVVWLLILGIIKVSKSLVYNLSLKNNKINEVETNNLEISNVNTLSKVMDIKPDLKSIPDISNEVLEYVDIVPIKKAKNKIEETKEIEQLEVDDSKISLDNKENLVVNTEEVKEEVTTPIENFDILDKEVEEIMPKAITLSSYDSIFNVDKELEKNMDIVFEDNKLNNIMINIQELDKNVNDDNIKKVYDNIVVKQDELSLSDYNYLINELASLKK